MLFDFFDEQENLREKYHSALKRYPDVVDLPTLGSRATTGRLADGDDDKYSVYVAPKENHNLNDHVLVYGASGTGKSRGFVKPFILQAAKRMESLIMVDPKGVRPDRV